MNSNIEVLKLPAFFNEKRYFEVHKNNILGNDSKQIWFWTKRIWNPIFSYGAKKLDNCSDVPERGKDWRRCKTICFFQSTISFFITVYFLLIVHLNLKCKGECRKKISLKTLPFYVNSSNLTRFDQKSKLKVHFQSYFRIWNKFSQFWLFP